MLSSDINEACSGAGRERRPESAGLLPQLTQVGCSTEEQTQVATDEMLTQTEAEPSWDEVVEEWFAHGNELMIF